MSSNLYLIKEGHLYEETLKDMHTISHQFSPRGLIVNFETYHGSLFERELI